MNNQSQYNQLTDIFEQGIGFFINKISLTQATFPLMKLTYSLWRQNAYELCTKKFPENSQKLNYTFFLVSQRKYLREFIDRVEKQMNKYYRGFEHVQQNFNEATQFNKKEQRTYELTLELGEIIWEQQLYLQLIEDLIFLPYFTIFPKNTSLLVRNEYRTNFSATSKKQRKFVDKVYDKVSQTFVRKTLNKIAQFFLSKAFFFQIQTLVGTFNPIMMGASFGLSQYLSTRQNTKKQEELMVQLENAIIFAKNKIKFLKKNYEKCLDLLNIILSEEEQDLEKKKEELKKIFLTFYEEEWLQIEVERDGDWEVVQITEKEEFQELIRVESLTEDNIE